MELDVVWKRCAELRKLLRDRPCLPLSANGQLFSREQIDAGIQLPLYSCPWKGCEFSSNNRALFLHHVAGGAADDTHLLALHSVCKGDIVWVTRLDYVHGAAAVAERECWPSLGLSVTRRSLNLLCKRFNDKTATWLCCFVCGQLRTTCESYPPVDLEVADLRSTAGSQERYIERSCLVSGFRVSLSG